MENSDVLKFAVAGIKKAGVKEMLTYAGGAMTGKGSLGEGLYQAGALAAILPAAVAGLAGYAVGFMGGNTVADTPEDVAIAKRQRVYDNVARNTERRKIELQQRLENEKTKGETRGRTTSGPTPGSLGL